MERLETRDTPATFGLPWVDAQNVTLSFVPDGTNVAGVSSSLSAHMQGDGLSNSAWQGEILRAAQSWASQANINVGVVSDSGAAFATAGLPQGDSRFGDIRVSMRPLDASVLSITNPPGSSSDTSGGDIILNSTKHFSIGAKAGSYDLFTTLLQESGHALGMSNSSIVNSVMYENYQGVRTGLDSSDVSNLQSLYGTRQADAFEVGGNGTLATAKVIPTVATGTLFARGDITTAGDVDYFKFTTPSRSLMDGGATLNFRTTGVSTLAADVSLTDSSGKVLASQTSNGQPGTFFTFSTTQLSENTTYYVVVKASSGTTFNVGAYKASVVFTQKGAAAPADPTSAVAAQTYVNDAGTNETFATGTALQAVAGTTSQAHYAQFAQLSGVTDVDTYTVQAPATASGTTNLLVSVRAMSTGLPPVVQFYAANGRLLQAEQVSSTASAAVYQLRNVASGSSFGVQVSSAGSAGASLYNLQADFLYKAIDLTTTGKGTIDVTAPVAFHTLVVNQPQVVSLNFQAQAKGLSAPTSVWVRLFDGNGNVVSQWQVQPGALATQSLLLQPGEYTVAISSSFASAGTGLDYTLRVDTSTDPIGIAVTDPTLSTTTTTTTPPPPPIQFYTYDPIYYAWLVIPM